jgi:hypothetical protein
MPRRLSLVVGYVRKVDALPRDVRSLALVRRTAFVLDDELDPELYATLVAAVARVAGADRVVAKLDTGATVDVTDPADARAHLGDDPADAWPFRRVRYTREGAVVAVMASEPWVLAGGPRGRGPGVVYHDTFTLPVYAREDLSAPLEAEAATACGRHGVTFTRVIRAGERPSASALPLEARLALQMSIAGVLLAVVLVAFCG